MDLVVLIGSGAVGKMTVGQELMKITDFRLYHNHMMIEPVIEIFGRFDGAVISRLREGIIDAYLKTEYAGMIFTFMWAFDRREDWDYIRSFAARFEATGGTVYWVELVADQAVRLERNRTENRLRNKPSKRDLAVSEDRLLREDSYRLVSREGEIPFAHYMKIDNTHLAPDEAARMIKEWFRLPGLSRTALMNRVSLEPVRDGDLRQMYDMQVESFMPLYEKYRDDGSPAIETFERVQARAAQLWRRYYFILKDGARVGAVNIAVRTDEEGGVTHWISPLFVLPRYQGLGIGWAAIQHAFRLYPDAVCWRLDTILQEPGNCHLYEKCGFVRVGEPHPVNERMTLVDYERRKASE